MVVTDPDGDPNGVNNGPWSWPGSEAKSSGGNNANKPVWTPGERCVDVDQDGKWDGFDEANNWMDWNGNGKPDNPGPWYDLNGDNQPDNPGGYCTCGIGDTCYLADSDNDGNPDCCPEGPGNPGCDPYPAPNACPPTQWTNPVGNEIIDCNGNLIDDALDIAMGTSLDILPYEETETACVPGAGNDIPDECEYANYSQSLICLDGAVDADSTPNCYGAGAVECQILAPPRIPMQRCEYYDANESGSFDIVEPFENFLRRWDPCLLDPDTSQATHWVKVFDPNSLSAGTYPDRLNAEESYCDPAYKYVYDYGDPVYIEVHFPSDPEPVKDQTNVRVIRGKHDPFNKLTSCVCANGEPCDGNGECIAGVHVQYSSPDTWSDADAASTKIQARGMLVATPEPGTFPPYANPPVNEKPWFDAAWQDRYAIGGPSATPAWPQGWNAMGSPPPQFPHPGAPVYNSPKFVELPDTQPGLLAEEPYQYDSAVNRRYFKANAGGTRLGPGEPYASLYNVVTLRSGVGFGWTGGANRYVNFEVRGPNSFEGLMDRPILPEEPDGASTEGIFFDGWVEHDDLPSSKYHLQGDQRFGEVTSPWNDDVWGQDRGEHEPNTHPPPGYGDQITVAAGPYAENIHGELGRDAGNLAMMEMLTWRWYAQDRNSLSYGDAWEAFFGTYHPYAGPGT